MSWRTVSIITCANFVVILFLRDGIETGLQSAADFFDLETYPGMRAMRDAGPEYNLPFALLADGARPEDVDPLLETMDGAARAFAT